MRQLIVTDSRLQFRDWSVVSFGLLFPAVLLVVLGFGFPGFREPNPDLDGGRLVDLYTPIMLVLDLAMVVCILMLRPFGSDVIRWIVGPGVLASAAPRWSADPVSTPSSRSTA